MGFELKRALAAQIEGKAIPAHPALMDRTTPVSVYSPGAARVDATISQREASHHMEAYGGKEAIDWVYDAIGLYSDPAATAPFHLEKEDGTRLYETKRKGTPPDHSSGPSDLYNLLRRPNPFMLYTELMSLLVIDLMLVGNAYWMKWQTTSDGRPLALYRLAPSHVNIVPGPFGPKRYEYKPPGVRSPLKIDPDQMIHFRRPNPHSAYYGMGVIQGAGRSMDLELALTNTTASYYENKADPSLIVQSERRVPRDVFNKLRAQLRARVSGSHRAGELLVLEAGLKASSLSTSARDALFAELSKMSRDRVWTKFRTSPVLYGILDESTGSNKVSDVRREFDTYALGPFLARLSETISEALTMAWGCQFMFDYRTQLPSDEAVKVAGQIGAVPGVKVREVRAQYAQFGIEESTGDPEIDEMVLNLPGEELGPDGQPVNGGAGFADRNLPTEPGRPPKGTNTRAFPAGAKARPAGKALTVDEIEARLGALAEIEGKAVNSAGEKVTVGNKLQGEIRPEDSFAAARRSDIDAATTSIAAGLRDAAIELERGLLDTAEGKALKTSDIVKRIKQSPAWTTFKTRLESVLTDGARDAAASGVMHAGRIPDEDVDYDEIAQTIIHRPEGLRGILKTIRDRVARRVAEVRDADGERSDYEAAIRAAISDWSDRQAVAIADSEATEAYNEATLTTLELAGETHTFVTDGDEDDQPCIDADGSVWTIDEARKRRKEHPRCRRAFLAVEGVG